MIDVAGQPVPGLEVEIGVFGANTRTLRATTDENGFASTSYTGLAAGTDTITAVAFVSGLREVSNALTPPVVDPRPRRRGRGRRRDGRHAPAGAAGDRAAVPGGRHHRDQAGRGLDHDDGAGRHVDRLLERHGDRRPRRHDHPGERHGRAPRDLAVFDPSVVPNDTYTITVSGTTTAGGVQTASTSVVVQGNLKPGRYITTYQDAVLPVDGFQIGLRRVYDSIDRAPRELGFNWHLSLADFRVSANRALGDGGWSAAPSRCSFFLCEYAYKSTAPHFVTVTYPDGRQEIFDFTPAGGVGPFYWLGTAAFTARPGTGTTSTLEVEGDNSVMYRLRRHASTTSPATSTTPRASS